VTIGELITMTDEIRILAIEHKNDLEEKERKEKLAKTKAAKETLYKDEKAKTDVLNKKIAEQQTEKAKL
jgi:hypothetical protein